MKNSDEILKALIASTTPAEEETPPQPERSLTELKAEAFDALLKAITLTPDRIHSDKKPERGTIVYGVDLVVKLPHILSRMSFRDDLQMHHHQMSEQFMNQVRVMTTEVSGWLVPLLSSVGASLNEREKAQLRDHYAMKGAFDKAYNRLAPWDMTTLDDRATGFAAIQKSL